MSSVDGKHDALCDDTGPSGAKRHDKQRLVGLLRVLD
jgi:hypothetical protein